MPARLLAFFVLLLTLFALLPAQAQPTSQWSRCAREGEPCYIPYGAVVAYGARGVWAKKTFAREGNIDCSNRTFGDPVPGVVKSCHFLVKQPPRRPAQWTVCADEGEPCFVPYSTTVAYGASGVWAKRQVNAGTIDCSNRTFGDPFPGIRKKCHYLVPFRP